MMSSVRIEVPLRFILSLAVLVATLSLTIPAQAGWHSLTGKLPAYAGAHQITISPDSHYVVFIADAEVDERLELYSVPITGTLPTKLNPTPVAGGQVYAYEITPDSQYVIYTAKQEAGESRADLYRVPIAGGSAVKLNVAFSSGRHVGDFKIDPDNVRVVYQAEQLVANQTELLSVRIAGGQGAKLNSTLVAGGNVLDFEIDPIGDRVVYQADQEVNERVDLYGAPIAGGAAIKLNPPGSIAYDFAIDPAAALVVFRAWSGSAVNLYLNVTAGSAPVTLNDLLEGDEAVIDYHISTDGGYVVYNVASGVSELGNLYSIPIGGDTSTPLTTAEPGFGVSEFDITPDGQRVVYSYQENGETNPVLESVSIDGGERATLYQQQAGEALVTPLISPDSQWVVYSTLTLLAITSPSVQAYSIPAGGGTSVALGAAALSEIMPDSSRVLAYSPKPSEGYDLYSIQISGGDGRNLSRVEEQVETWESVSSPDGQWIVFRVIHSTGENELRVSDGAEAPPPTPTPTPSVTPTPPPGVTPPPTVYREFLPFVRR